MRESRDQQYTSSQTLERLLNEAIIHADISKGFEEYIEIFDTFYADDIEVSSDVIEEPVRGKSRVTSLLFNFLVPLHVMAEVAGLSISIRETALPADADSRRGFEQLVYELWRRESTNVGQDGSGI